MNLSSFAALVEIAVLSAQWKGPRLGSLCLPLIRAGDNPRTGSFCQRPYITRPLLPGTNRLLSVNWAPLIWRQQAWEHPVRPQIQLSQPSSLRLSHAVWLHFRVTPKLYFWSRQSWKWHVGLERALWKCLCRQSHLSTELNCSRAICILRRNSFGSPSTFLCLLLLHILCHHHITKWILRITKLILEIFPLHFMDFICALFSHDCLSYISRELTVLLSRANKPGINLI